jgi:phage terminase large subunit-like protein
MELDDTVKPALLRNIYDPVTKLLWVDRFDDIALQPYRKKKLYWNTQYQQNPTPLEGTLIKREWLKKLDFFSLPQDKKSEILNVQCDLYIDSAFTANPDRDETAVILAGKWGQNLLIKKCWILYLEFPDLLAKLTTIYHNEMNKKGMLRVEPKANGLSIIQSLKRSGLNITQTPTPKESKVLRVTSILNELEAGRVYVMESGDLLIQQAIAFPSAGSRDGLIDVLYYAVDHNLHTSGIKIKKVIR